MISSIRRLGLLAAFIALGTSAFAFSADQQIKITRALNSPTLAVKYSGVHAALVELRLNGESFGTRTMDDSPTNGETTFSLDLLTLKDGDNDLEIRLYDKDGHVVGTEKTVISTDQNTKGPIYLTTPKVGENVMGPVEITVGFGRDFKNSYVSFFVDNQFKSMMNFPPFTYNWDTTRESNGWHELEAWVVDDTSATFKTRKVRVFVNNPGGHTYRVTAPASKPVVKNSVPVTKHLPPVIKPTKGVAALPEPEITDLTTSSNVVSTPVTGSAAPLKTIAHAASTAAMVKTTAMAPAVLGFVSQNAVAPQLESHSAGMKPAPMPSSVAIGPRVMTPTGKRVVAQKAPAVVSAPPAAKTAPKPVAEITKTPVATVTVSPIANPVTPPALSGSAPVKPQVAPAALSVPATPVAVPARAPQKPVADVDTGTLVALVPATHTETVAATFKPLALDMTGEGMVARPAPAPAQPSAPVVPASTPTAPAVTSAAMTSMGSTDSVIKSVPVVAAKPMAVRPAHHAKLITVEYGTRLPIHSTYSIVYNGNPLTFDVAPSVVQGVPVTPFRHLIEHAGGDVKWEPADHEVEATTDGKTIWLKIGDKVARIDSLAVQLELAPFLQGGRTIVPLSFIKKALNVDIDYDKVTGHVLITPKK